MRRVVALQLLIPAALLGLFALPFVSASCNRAESEVLTGWELVVGGEPALVGDADRDPSRARESEVEVRRSLRAARDVARVELGFILGPDLFHG